MRKRAYESLTIVLGLTVIAGLALTGWARSRTEILNQPPIAVNHSNPIHRAIEETNGRTLTDMICTLSGSVQSGSGGQLSLTLDSAGGLPGTFTIDLKYNSAGEVSGGHWKVEVAPTIGEGAIPSTNSLAGSVIAGTLTVSEGGLLTSLSASKLSITEGQGSYQGVTGTGSVTLNSDPERQNNLIGDLSLSF